MIAPKVEDCGSDLHGVGWTGLRESDVRCSDRLNEKKVILVRTWQAGEVVALEREEK